MSFLPGGGPSSQQLYHSLRNIAGVIGVGTGIYFISSSLYNVEAGHRAIKYSRIKGIIEKVYGEGTHFAWPWIERPIVYDCRARPKSIASLTGTKDLQMVDITIRVLFKPDEHVLPSIYRELGKDYEERVLPSIINEVLKSVVAQFNASQLITQREKVSLLVRQRLVERASAFHILLEDVSLTSIQFSEQFATAVEQKQVALQQAQRAAFVVDKAKQEQQSITLRAEGEAESAKLIGTAMAKNPSFLELRKIEAAREIAHTLAKSQNKAFVPADTLMLSNLFKNASATN